MPNTLTPAASFPDIEVATLGGGDAKLGVPNREHGNWRLIVV